MKTFYIVGGLIVAGLLIGAIWFFGKSSKDETKTSTTTQTDETTGLSGLIASLNLSGVTIFGK